MTNETKGQTLQDLNVKVGDVVEYAKSLKYTVKDKYILKSHTSGDDCHYKHWWNTSAQFCIISRASDPKWLPCPPNYTPQDNHEVTYHMGVPTHYYVNGPVVVDGVRELVTSNGEYYTAKGQTHDGKPVGQWVIDMD